MNFSPNWCKMASLLCCLVLGIEGNLFVHNVATQARVMDDLQQNVAVIQESGPNHKDHRRWFL